MKRNMKTVAVCLMCVVLVICIFQNIGLKRELSNMQNNLSNQISYVQSDISNIYANIDNHLAEQENLLAVREPNWGVIKMDIDTETATVECTVVPKEYESGVTTAVAICNEKEYPLTFADGKFSTELQIPLFEDSKVSEVQFTENGKVRTQALDWFISPRYDLFPNVYANFMGGSTCEKKNGGLVYEGKGEVEIQIERKSKDTTVKSLSLLAFQDGKEQKRINVPKNTTRSQSGGRHMEEAVWELDGENLAQFFYYDLNQKFKIPYGSTFDLYIEVVDNNDLHYRTRILHMYVDEKGDSTEESGSGAETGIYDKNGNELYLSDKY